MRERPRTVPDQLANARSVLKSFFRTIDDADSNDARLNDALQFLDLGAIPPADRVATFPPVQLVLLNERYQFESMRDEIMKSMALELP